MRASPLIHAAPGPGKAKVRRDPAEPFARLARWITQAGGKVAPLVLKHSASSGHGVHAAVPIAPGEVVLRVPQRCLLTSDAARLSAIGRQITAAKVEPASNHTWLAAYLLQERHAARSQWQPYLDLLPPTLASYRHIPLLFDAQELELLRGSLLIERIQDKWETLTQEYARLADGVTALRELGFAEYVWARLTVASRIFGVTIAGHRTQALIPGADLLNHKLPAETHWGYRDTAGGFVLTAEKSFAAGQPLHDSYGRKCNSRYFMTYGFALPENPDNEARIRFTERDGERAFVVPARYEAPHTQQMFAFLRGNRNQHDPSKGRNEQKVVRALAAACEYALRGFDNTLAEDDALLAEPRMTVNVRNCILMRRGEKRVLQTFIRLAETAIPVLQMLPHYARRRAAAWDADHGRMADYFDSVLLPRIR